MNGFFKGMGMGLIAGAAITAAVVPMDRRKVMKSPVGKTIRTVSDICGTIHDAF